MGVKLSIVVIARNEELSIPRCIEGLKTLSFLGDGLELVFVDSSSSDRTMELMCAYADLKRSGVKVLRCSGDLNAAVVRRCGFAESNGEFVFFIDGDTEVNPDFVKAALARLALDSSMLAVSGRLSDVMYDDDFGEILGVREDRNNIDREKEVVKFGGNVLVRRSAYEKVGGWNPDFVANEDFDLAIRLSGVGRILALPLMMGRHHTRWRDIYKRSHMDVMRGTHSYYGQLIRKNLNNTSDLKKCLSVNRGHQIGVAYLAALIVSVFFSFAQSWIWSLSVPLLVFLDCTLAVCKRKVVIDHLILRIIVPFYVVYGFLKPNQYKGKSFVEIVFPASKANV